MRAEKGFTLVELLVAVSVFTLLMALVGMGVQGGSEQVRITDAKMNLEEAARESLYRMAQEVRETSPTRVGVTNNGRSLVFQIPANVNNSGTITWSNPITYQVGGNGSQLTQFDSGTGQMLILANDIQNVQFTTTGNPVNTVTFTVTASRNLTNGRTLTVTSAGEARLRNA